MEQPTKSGWEADAPREWLHPAYSHPAMRAWQCERRLHSDDLMYPVFVSDEDGVKQAIESLPGQARWGVDRLKELLDPLVAKGLRSIMLFGCLTDMSDGSVAQKKDNEASAAFDERAPVLRALKYLRQEYPALHLCADVCVCAYTDHGHCGVLNDEGLLDNVASVDTIARLALQYVRAGAHMVAPSDMMDDRVRAIKETLARHGLAERAAVMSYAAKYASAFYGPFRDACASAPGKASLRPNPMKDRSMYQLPFGSQGLGRKALWRDARDADVVMVKPGGPYLDLVSVARQQLDVPVAIYHVSGEYAMLWHAAQAGALDLKDAVLETLQGFRRAGASVLITYYAPQVLEWLHEDSAAANAAGVVF